ncbi:MAG TPA: O-antigen ligase domain-containing protein, partial [Firmicutes bacterium]|nr:O-antigen ligase domain-containing protein [Bacillota bacterium]
MPLILSRLTVDSAIFKTVYSQSFILIAFALWILRVTLRKELNLVKTPLNIPFIALLIWAVFSAFFISWNKYEAIKVLAKFGSYYLLFFIFIDTIRDKYKFNFILHTLFYVSGIILTYGLMQRFRLDLFQWEQASSVYRILSTFGNSIFYGNFLVFVIPIFLLLGIFHFKELAVQDGYGKINLFNIFFKFIIIVFSASVIIAVSYGLGRAVKEITSRGGGFDNPLIKIILILIILFYILICFLSSYLFKRYFFAGFFLGFGMIGIYSNILTKSRGAWIGLTAGIILSIMFIIFELSSYYAEKKVQQNSTGTIDESSVKRIRFKYFFALTGAIVILIISFSAFSYRFLPGDIKNRLKEFNLKSRTVKVRMTIMKGALNMIRSRPVFGYGIGSFQVEFPEHRPKDYMLNGVSHNTINAHNEYLQIGAETGIIGLVLFLILVFSYFKIILYYLLNASSSLYKYMLFALSISIIGAIAHNGVCVNMRFTSGGLFFYLFFAFSIALINIKYNKPQERTENIAGGKTPLSFIIFLLLFIFIVPKGNELVWKQYRSNHALRNGNKYDRDSDIFKRETNELQFYFNQLSTDTNNRELRTEAANHYKKFLLYWLNNFGKNTLIN